MEAGGASRWRVVGNDPQFLLVPHNTAVLRRSGWAVLRFDLQIERPMDIELLLDLGVGFLRELAIKQRVESSGAIEIPVFLPIGIRNLRLDPGSSPGAFGLANLTLQYCRQPELDTLPNESRAVYQRLQQLNTGTFSLVPAHQLSREMRKEYQWHSTGTDPSFLLRKSGVSGPLLAPGWYQLRLKMTLSQRIALAKLYFDSGRGFNECEVFSIRVASDEVVSRFVWVEKVVNTLRFDPMEAEGSFSVEHLSMESVEADIARQGMLEHLAAHHSDWSASPAGENWNKVERDAHSARKDALALLAAAYNDCIQVKSASVEYETWIDSVEALTLPTPEAVKGALDNMVHKPTISILMPVYNTAEPYLRACIESVLRQSYPYWELCIADDHSSVSHVRDVLEEYRDKDERIRVVFRNENGHISRASNSALEMARGDWVALLDHDDLLAEHALLFIAQALNENPDARILYSDEDKIDERGCRFDPHFKSDWNPDLFYSQNYVSHLGVYARELLVEIGGFRTGVEGSQDQDLLLRCLPLIEPSQIIHIPRVLYHWRALKGSTALNAEEKSYTTEAGIRALSDYFKANGPEGVSVESGLVPNTYRVRWPVPDPAPLVSLLIPTRDKKAITELAVNSILEKTTYPHYEILILDNGSVEPQTLNWFDSIQKDKRVRVLRWDHPFNYSAINNFGVEHANGTVIGLVNNDVEVISPNWLTEMVSHVCREEIGCVGAKLYYGNDTLQHGGVILGLGGVAGHSHKHFPREASGYFHRLMLVQNLSAVTAACLLVRKAVFEEVGGLDEKNLTVAFNDVDFCIKVSVAGYRNLWTPYAELYHHESISRGKDDSPDKIKRFKQEVKYMRKRWSAILDADPFYNKNLTRDREDFSIGR
jgi:GT2 family glycosyltransferase